MGKFKPGQNCLQLLVAFKRPKVHRFLQVTCKNKKIYDSEISWKYGKHVDDVKFIEKLMPIMTTLIVYTCRKNS